MRRALSMTALAAALASLAVGGLAACQGCHKPTTSNAPEEPGEGAQPTVRLYVLSTVAGALEPCGCSKDQLGGIDKVAALMAKDRAAAPDRLVVGAGPLLFEDPVLTGDASTQGEWKAEALARAARDIGLAAWAPGANDWAAGNEALARYRDASGATLLAGNLEGAPDAVGHVIREVGGVKIGLVGVSDPRDPAGSLPKGVTSTAALESMRAGVAAARAAGAEVLVGLAALPRGEALRLADALPELNVLVLGKPSALGPANDAPKPPVLVGPTLVVEPSNHLQTVAVVDLFVRKKGEAGVPLVFADATGVEKAEELLALNARIRDLEARVNSWEKGGHVDPKDLAQRRADLERMRGDKARMEASGEKVTGSFFRYALVEVRDALGRDAQVAGRLLDLYKRVNEHNKVAFADRKPEPPLAGQASYVGVEACSECHEEPRKVWDATAHGRAYATLEKGFKEYNLECVGCHVTGYLKPGGSTVTHNESLQNVQCEQCHGPGSLHVKDPGKAGLITRKPEPQSCVSACHHPPHVEGFDPLAKMKLILGPGHGL